MKPQLLSIFWTVILFFLVGLSLASMQGYVAFDRFAGTISIIIFSGLSAVSFLSYFVSGIRKWGWLFPALAFASLAMNSAGIFTDYGSPIVAFPILLSVAIPFYVGYLLDRKQWGWLVPAWFLTVITVIPPLSALINQNLLAALVLYSISLPFVVGCFTNPDSRWPLFIATSLGFIGVFSLVESFIHGDNLGSAVLLLIALPFFAAYHRSKKNWWALIPSGVFTTIGLVALLDRLLPAYDYILIGDYQLGVYTSLLFMGLAVTFNFLRRSHLSQRMEWAKYPTIGLLTASLMAFLMGESFMGFLPLVAMLVTGVVMVSAVFLKRGVTHQPTS